MDFVELKESISNLYRDFFINMKIDFQTGIVEGTNKRFSGYPYIGSNYVNAPMKILFIPYDTGVDERYNKNTFHNFESRVEQIPVVLNSKNELEFNPHIAGVYATALYFLKDKMNLQEAWDALWSEREYTMKKAIIRASAQLPVNLMSYVAYENRFRFVTIGRKERGGGNDRNWLNTSREARLLLDEVNVFNPDIIVVQGKTGLWNCNIEKLKEKYCVIIAQHPSSWRNGANKLQYIVENIGSQL